MRALIEKEYANIPSLMKFRWLFVVPVTWLSRLTSYLRYYTCNRESRYLILPYAVLIPVASIAVLKFFIIMGGSSGLLFLKVSISAHMSWTWLTQDTDASWSWWCRILKYFLAPPYWEVLAGSRYKIARPHLSSVGFLATWSYILFYWGTVVLVTRIDFENCRMY